MSAALLTQGEARAQGTALLSPSMVTPADVAIYAELSLDPESEELQQLDDLFLRLGSEDSLIEAIEESASDATGNIDIAGAVIAVAILPSFLEEAAESGAPELDDMTNTDFVASELEAAATGVGGEGIGIVIAPPDVAQFERELSSEAGAGADSEEYLGFEIVSYTDEDGDPTAYVVIEEFVVVSTSPEEAKLFVDASQDAGGSLAGVDEFLAASDALPAERVAFAYMNGELVIDALAVALDDPMLTPIVSDVLSTYRAHIGMTLAAESDGIRIESVMIPLDGVAVEAKGTADGLMSADQMPANTVTFAAGYDLGQTTAIRLVGLVLVAAFNSASSNTFDDTEATPVPMSIDEMYEAVAMFLGFNLKTDFIDQLTGPYAFGVWNIEGEDPANVGAVLVSGTEDPIVVSDTVDSLSFLIQAAGQGEINVVSRQVGDASVNNVTFESGETTMSIDYGVVDDQFVLGFGDGVETLFAGPEDSLADSPRYISALAHLPEEYEAIQYIDLAAIQAAEQGIGDTGEIIDDVVGTPVAVPLAEAQAESWAAVTYVEDGFSRTSQIIVVP